MKNILVVTHERAGTHLVINIINKENNGDFIPIGKLPLAETRFDLENYTKFVKRHILYQPYNPDVVFKAHHQVEFFESYIDKLFENFKVIYVKRDIKDVLISYYKFLNIDGFDKNGKSIIIPNFPEFKDWIFMKPCEVGYKYFERYPDPHVFIEPSTYIERYTMHLNGWMRYKDKFLLMNYEDVLSDFNSIKEKLEIYLNKKVENSLPDLHDKSLPNFVPNKGIVGAYKEVMDDDLIRKITSII